MESTHQVLIVGGGTAGLTVAARLRNAEPNLDIAVIEPSEFHYYQPLWTLVGAGIFPKERSRRNERDYIPRGVSWVRDAVTTLDPEHRRVQTREGRTIGYEQLVVAPGLQIRWDAIPGLKGSVGANGVCSNYSYETVDYTWETIRSFQGGTALFTHPLGAVKCGGAPQKIMYLAEEHFRRAGIRDRCKVGFATALPFLFAVERYSRTLERIVAERKIETHFEHELIAIRPDAREAVFRRLGDSAEVVISYDMIHVTPPMGPPAFVADSSLADPEGWVDVDRNTLQHVRFPDVFGIGDASNLPTSKTGAAIRKQAPALVANLLAARRGTALTGSYNGYTSCPIVTGYHRLVMAEFDYDKILMETFPFDQSRPRSSMMMLKKYGLPALYWNAMLRGRF